MTHDLKNLGTLLSGDQNVFWDAALKLAILSAHGLTVLHDLHNTDNFSAVHDQKLRELHKEGSRTSREAYLADGRLNRWTATLELAPFLGRHTLHPEQFGYIDARAIARITNTTLDGVWINLTEGDWCGISLGQENLVAHGIRTADIAGSFKTLRKDILANIRATVTECKTKTIEAECGSFLTLTGDTQHLLHQAQLYALQMQQLTNIELTTTADMWNWKTHKAPLLKRFVEEYALYRELYNKAISGPGEDIGFLEEGKLPYYAVVRTKENILVRRNLCIVKNDLEGTVRTARENQDEEIVAVVGKAVTLFNDLRLTGPIVMPELGSAYANKAKRFAQLIKANDPAMIANTFHPVVRVKCHALDALADIETTFRLPEYLQKPFGTEWISGKNFAAQWRDVVAQAKNVTAQLLSTNEKQTPFTGLAAGDALTAILCETKGLFDTKQTTYHEQLIQEIERAKQTKGDIRATRERIDQQHDRESLTLLQQSLHAIAENRRARLLKKALHVAELGYWNARPFFHWILAIPGWKDAIIRRAEIIVENDDS